MINLPMFVAEDVRGLGFYSDATIEALTSGAEHNETAAPRSRHVTTLSLVTCLSKITTDFLYFPARFNSDPISAPWI